VPEPRLELLRDLEALLFASGRPLDLAALTAALSHTGAVAPADAAAALAILEAEYPPDGPHGFELARVGEGWVFRTNRLAEAALTALFDLPEDPRLSPAALETLAIVAYLQPVTRPEIGEIRGVNSDSPVQTLLDRELIAEAGRSTERAGAILYRTTERFLLAFGLGTTRELPPLEGFAVGAEQREEIRQRLGVIVAPG
jgi:segregation and condensation protein B